jgi:FAD/FMN-containing dehydrogenase
VTTELERELRSFLPAGSVLEGAPASYLADETESRGLRGRADAVVVPETAEEVAEVVSWCYEHGVAIVPRGGGTGFAAGAIPLDGGVVVSLEWLTGVRAFEPLLWRIWVEAGFRTAELRRIVRESGQPARGSWGWKRFWRPVRSSQSAVRFAKTSRASI